jgi:hypothetical protein
MAAVGITAATGGRVPLGRTALPQLASSVDNRVSPGGTAAVATIARYLERSGLTRVGSVASAEPGRDGQGRVRRLGG